MTNITPIRESLIHEDVTTIVKEEMRGWTENLMSRVTIRVRVVTGTPNKVDLPYDVSSWIYQDCKSATNDANIASSTGKDTKPSNLVSLSDRMK